MRPKVTATRLTTAALLLAMAAVAAAQDSHPRPKWVILPPHEEGLSRAAFAACDGDGDDRLDIFEALRCLPQMGSLAKPRGFARLDRNRDGYLQWDEFDQRYQELGRQGGSLRIRPGRPLRLPPVAKKQDPAQRAVELLLEMVDKDHDQELSKAEFQEVLKALELPAAGAAFFPALDQDRSGKLSEKELRPIVSQVPSLLQLALLDPGAGGGGTLRFSDENGDQQLDGKELKRGLLRLQPGLSRWTKKVLREADKNGDGKLQGLELAGDDGKGNPTEKPKQKQGT